MSGLKCIIQMENMLFDSYWQTDYTYIWKGADRECNEKSYHIMIFVILQGNLMKEERRTSKMIKKCLYVEFASLRHYLICLHLLGMFVKTWEV